MNQPQGTQDLMKRFLTDKEFRSKLMAATDPKAVLSEYGFSAPDSVVNNLTNADPAAVEQAVQAHARGEDPGAC